MKKIINVPYYSQYEDIKDEYWKPRACGALCLKMVLDFIKPTNISEEEFVRLANKKGAYGEHGWIHQGLIDIAKGFGVEMERKEFKQKKDEENLDCFATARKDEFSEGKFVDDSLKANRLRERSEVIQEKNSLEQGIGEIIESIKNNKPVIVSAIKKWSEEKKFHMVVLTGFELNENKELKGFYYNDTDYNNEKEGKNLFVDIETFKKYWRRLAIFVE